MNSFYELLKGRHSIRKYSAQPVESDKIDRILQAALMSPASRKRNPWEFIVVNDKSTLNQLAASKKNGSHFLENSPLGIVVIADTTLSDVWVEDASIAALIMQLQAQDLGLGSCWVQIHQRVKDDTTSASDYVRSILNIPEHYAVLCIVSIGYPAETKNPFQENQLAFEKIHINKY